VTAKGCSAGGGAMRELLRIQALVFCCYLGGIAGAGLTGATLGRWALERYRAEHPGAYVCGLFSLPYLALGFVPGAVAGWLLWRWKLPRAGLWHCPRPRPVLPRSA
jgi:hypothetical protein